MIKKLVSHLGEYKRAAILTPILSALEAIMDVLLPTIMAFIIDQGIEKGDMNAVVKYGLLTFLVAAIALLLGVLAGRFAATASTGFAGNLRDAMYENIQHFSFSNIDKYSTAGLVTRMTTDVTNLQNAFQMIERMCVRAPVHLVFALIMASMISRSLTMVFLVAIVFLVAVLAGIMVPTFGIFDKVFKNYDNLNASVQENVSAIRVVKSFVREHFENEKYNNPVNLYVADFIGNPSINFADGKAEVGPDGMTITSPLGKMVFPKKDLTDMLPKEKSFDAVLGIRPEQVSINTTRQSPSDIEAHIYTSMPAGSETLVTVKVGGVSLVIKALGITHYNPDQIVYLSIDLNKINVFDKKSTNLIKYSV